ncbi:DUF885 domain-containing protein [Pseudofulvibacter geojedonensis]|uniref:DUF885 domain-containing protein n=1 Tax=Pseudofulvibacter geojedonensis TaxID=1123758 RepID=A0ABW3HYG2_9FLAO
MKYIAKLSLSAMLVVAFSSCKKDSKSEVILDNTEAITKESVKLNTYFENQFVAFLDRHPQSQTRLGIKDDYDKWDDISPYAKALEVEESKKALSYLIDSIQTSLLNEDDLLSYQLYKQTLENEIADHQYVLYKYPVEQMHGMQAEIPAFLINMHQIETEDDAEDYIARLNGIKPLFNQLEENLKASEKQGVMIPKFVFAHVISDSENIIKGYPFDKTEGLSTLYEDFKEKIVKIDLGADKTDTLFIEAEKALLESVLPAYKSLISLLKEQEKTSSTDDGVWKFPKGEAFYSNALKRTTTTNLTADEIHEIGLSEVKRIHSEMNAIKEQVGFNGTLQEFFTFMRTDKEFYFPATASGKEQYMKKATAIIDSMKTRLDELFLTKPKAGLQVKQVEAFREKSAGKAFYQGPSKDGKRPGTYYANMYDMASMPSYQMEALAYHEGIPGHHMQISIAQELKNVPEFRKYGRYTAYIEGWGLYSEFIPKEMGFYSDPYSNFGRLAMELWRSCRLVVDTGIHAKKWTRQQGIDYYSTNTPNAIGDCVKMVERHIVMPSQATAYKIGMNKIIELREKAKKQLGAQFDIREFHDVVLVNGPIPLNVLEDLVDKWVNDKK